MWEDAGYEREEFNRIGLYGAYTCRFVKMKYLKRKKILEIYSNGSNKIVRVNSIESD
jgi:hypothetical protein